jgi:hypothetical protein
MMTLKPECHHTGRSLVNEVKMHRGFGSGWLNGIRKIQHFGLQSIQRYMLLSGAGWIQIG